MKIAILFVLCSASHAFAQYIPLPQVELCDVRYEIPKEGRIKVLFENQHVKINGKVCFLKYPLAVTYIDLPKGFLIGQTVTGDTVRDRQGEPILFESANSRTSEQRDGKVLYYFSLNRR